VTELLALGAAILAAVAAAAGLFSTGLYRDAPFWVEQAKGIDVATLFLAAPILVISLSLGRSGWSSARALTIGVLLYLVYNYAIYATSIAMNRLALIYIAVLGLSIWSLVLYSFFSATGLAPFQVGFGLARVIAVFLLVVAVLFVLLWLSQIAGSTASGVPPADLMRAGLPANPVYALDLAFFLPLAFVAAIGILRSIAPAEAFAVPMLTWIFLTSAGIAGGFLFEARAGEQVPAPVAVAIAVVGIAAIALVAATLATAKKAFA
jgi:hypothetical protein